MVWWSARGISAETRFNSSITISVGPVAGGPAGVREAPGCNLRGQGRRSGITENLIRTFGLEPVDFDGIRDAIGAQIRASGETLGEALNERALQIHLQRIVGAHVASAYGAAQFYGAKLSAAKDLTTRLGNNDRDEDRGGPSGFEDKAARARRFVAEMALQSYALRAAAEGAVLAYAEVTGETWKAYKAPATVSASISRRGAAVGMAAFQNAIAELRDAHHEADRLLQFDRRFRPSDPTRSKPA